MTSTDVEAVEQAPPVDDARNAIVAGVAARLGDALVDSYVRPGEDIWIRVTVAAWADTFRLFRDTHRATYFNWLSAIDWMPSPFGRDMDAQVDNIVDNVAPKAVEERTTGIAGGDTRFQVVARVNNVAEHWGINVKADVAEDSLVVPSIISVYSGANWHEREVHEMYGISFAGHPDLRKLYLPTDFEGYPLRKDFPLLARRIRPWPGIVDIEQMPGEDDADDGDEA